MELSSLASETAVNEKLANLEAISRHVQEEKDALVRLRQDALDERLAADERTRELLALEPVILERLAAVEVAEGALAGRVKQEEARLEAEHEEDMKDVTKAIKQAHVLAEEADIKQVRATAQLDRAERQENSLYVREAAIAAREASLASQAQELQSSLEISRVGQVNAEARLAKAEAAEARASAKLAELDEKEAKVKADARDVQARDRYLSLWEAMLDKREKAYEGMARSTNTQEVLKSIKVALEAKPRK